MCPFGISGFKRKGKTAVGYCQDVRATTVPTGISWHAGHCISYALQPGKAILSDCFSPLGVYITSSCTSP